MAVAYVGRACLFSMAFFRYCIPSQRSQISSNCLGRISAPLFLVRPVSSRLSSHISMSSFPEEVTNESTCRDLFSCSSWVDRRLTCDQHNRMLVWVELHLSGYPGSVEMGVPPALLFIVGVFVLVRGPDEGNAEIALLAVHCHFLMLSRRLRSWVLLSYR